MSFTITFSDGTQITGLKLNGNNFITTSEVDAEKVKTHSSDGYIGHVVISGDDEGGAGLLGTHEHTELVRCEYDAGLGGYAFALRDIPAQELENEALKARVKFLEIMQEA